MNSIFKRYTWILILLSIMSCSTGLVAMSAVQEAITLISSETEWEDQVYELNDLLDSENNDPVNLDATTQTTLFDLLTKVYEGRLSQYKNSMGSKTNLSDLSLMLTNAQNNPMFSDTQRRQITNYQFTLAVEQIVLQNNTEKNIDLQVNNVLSAMGSTRSSTFDAIIQSLFYQQLTSLFQKRSSLTPSSSDRLNTAFINAKKSALVQDSNKPDINTKSDILTIEATLRRAARDSNYNNAIKTVGGLQVQDASKKFEDFTQTLNFNTISKLYNNRTAATADDTAALIAMLTPAVTSSLLNTTQQASVKAMLANLLVQDGIKKAIANTSFIDKVKAMASILSTNASTTLGDDTKTQLANALNQLATNYPKTEPDAIAQLKELLNAAINSPLLNDADKAKLKALLPQLDIDLENAKLAKQLQDILAIQDPAARLAALQKFMADNAGKTLPPDIQKMLQDGIKALVDSRSKDHAFLSNLSNFVSGLGNSGLLSPDFKTQIASSLPAINSDRDSALLGKTLQDILAIQDPTARLAALQKFMADNAGKTLPPDIQKMLQDGIKALVDSRSKDPAFLSNLSNFVSSLGNSGLLSPDFKTQIASSLPAINSDRDSALLGKTLQDILAIQDPAARLAALQKFMADNAGKTLPPDIQKMLQDDIKALVDSRSKDPAFLSNLSNFVSGLGNSGLLSPDFKTQIASSLPAINSDRDSALLGKSLQDILAIQDPAARLAALQKFMADNAGKTLPADLQKTLQDSINGLVNSGIKDPAFLSGLSNLVSSLGNNSMLTPDFKAQMATALPGINTTRDNATLGKSLQDILAIQDPAARLAALQKFMADNTGKTLPADLQKTLQDSINGLVNSDIKDPAFLSGLSNLVSGLGNNSMLTPDFKAQIATALPGINTTRDNATLDKSLQDILAIQDPAARLAALQKFMADNAGKTLPADLQKTLQDRINGLVNSGIKDPAFLSGVSNLVGGLGNNSMLTPDFKAQMATALPGINTTRDNATLSKSLQDILAIQDPVARLAALQKFLADNAGITFPADIQKILQDAINGLAKSGIKDPAFLGGLSNLVGGLSNSSLVTPDFKTQLGKDLQALGVITDPAILGKLANPSTGLPGGNSIPGATGLPGTLGGATLPGLQNPNQLGITGIPGATGSGTPVNPAALNQALQNILAIQDPAARLAALQKFMADHAGITLPADIQKMLQDAINVLAKSGIKDPAFLGGLSNLVGGLSNSSLVTPDFKTQLGKDLQSLGILDPATIGKLVTPSTGLPLGSSLPVGVNLPGTFGGTTLPGLQNPNQLGITGIPGATGTSLANIDPAKRLSDITNMTDLKLQANALSSFVRDNAGKTLPAEQQQALSSSLQKALQGVKSLDPASLGALASAAQGAAQPGLIGQAGVASISPMLPSLQKYISALPASLPGITGLSGLPTAGNTALGNLPGIQTVVSGLPGTGLKPLGDLSMPRTGSTPKTGTPLSGLKSAQDFKMPGTPGLNTQAGNALAQLSNTQGKTLSGLPGTGMQSVTDLSMPVPARSGSSVADLTGLKPVQDLQMPGQGGQQGIQGGGDTTEQALAAELRHAMTLPTLREKMLGVNAVLAKVGNRQFTGELQNAYADAVQKLFEMRHGKDKAEAIKRTNRKKRIRKQAQNTSPKKRKNRNKKGQNQQTEGSVKRKRKIKNKKHKDAQENNNTSVNATQTK